MLRTDPLPKATLMLCITRSHTLLRLGRILIGRLLLLSDLLSSLNTGVTFAYFKPFGYCELDNAFLKLLYTKYEIKSLFSLIVLTSIISVWEAFLIFNLLTSKTKLERRMISKFIYSCRNCILRVSKTWFCGNTSVAQTSNYITEVVIKYFSFWKIFSYGFSIFL